jgi:deoxyribonuclease V
LKPAALHEWDLTPKEAIALQKQLRDRVIREDRIGAVNHVAGVDVGFEEGGKVTRAAVAVLSFPELELVDSVLAREPTRFPYVPGLLSFREAPAVLQAFARVRVMPDLLLYDGQGIAHPRRIGIASHVGLLLDLPSIGVAKTRLTGGCCSTCLRSASPRHDSPVNTVRCPKTKEAGRRSPTARRQSARCCAHA